MLENSVDTPVPVVNLTTGERLTGKSAPTLKNLATWLSEHQNYIIDMPTAGSPGSMPGTSGDLEPGEITKKPINQMPPKKEKPVLPPPEPITVIHRKTGKVISGGDKGPNSRTIVVWLEKNPDWEVAEGSAEKARQILPDRLLGRIQKKKVEQPTPQLPTSIPQQSQQDPLAALMMAAAAGDPAMQQLQAAAMAMMFNPFLAAGAAGAMNPWAGMFGGSPGGLAMPVNSTPSVTKKEEKALKREKQQPAQPSMEDLSPFLGGGGATGSIFGLNPLMMNPGLAAMTQLQVIFLKLFFS